MTKIYLAGSCGSEDRTMMKKVATQLRNASYEVYCPFELQIENAWDYTQEDWARLVFKADVEAIDNCDVFLMISPGRMGSAGTNWEQGYAYAKGKFIIVIQYTDQPTSLMTYSAANWFYNVEDLDFVASLVSTILSIDKGQHLFRDIPCRTVLT